jgi:Na+-translocating ferredoxin:NAD+ oxidoreductase RnfG subunit
MTVVQRMAATATAATATALPAIALPALLLAAAAAAPAPAAAQAAPPAKLAKSIERVYGPGARVDTVRVDSAVVLRVSREGALLGFAQVRNVKGKDQPITYLIATDSACALRDIDILVYREPQGGEVAYESWRKQFRGKTAAAPLQIGKDIRNVSGATISSNAVTRSVRQGLAQLTAWHAAGKLR